MKKQDKATTRDLSEADVSNMSDGVKVTIIRILAGLEKRMEDFREAFTVEIKELKNNQRFQYTQIANTVFAINIVIIAKTF